MIDYHLGDHAVSPALIAIKVVVVTLGVTWNDCRYIIVQK